MVPKGRSSSKKTVSAEAPRTFCIVLRVESGAILKKGSEVRVDLEMPHPRPHASAVLSNWTVPSVGDSPDPVVGLELELQCVAVELDQAVEEFRAIGDDLLSVISLATNAPIGLLQLDVAYETTVGADPRELLQQYSPPVNVRAHQGRIIQTSLTKACIEALSGHTDVERLRRAAGHYASALRAWGRGQEARVVSNLFVAAEAVTPVILRAYRAHTGLSRSDVAAKFGVELKVLDAEIRRRMVFSGHTAVYQAAKKVNDGLEHGFLSYIEALGIAKPIATNCARLVRQALLHELAQDSHGDFPAVADLRPFDLAHRRLIRGRFVGANPELAPADADHPRIGWESHPGGDESQRPEPGDGGQLQLTEALTIRMAEGLKFELAKIESSGVPPEGHVKFFKHEEKPSWVPE